MPSTISATAPLTISSGLHQACLCAKVCDDLRGTDTFVLDLRAVTPIFDFFIVTSATSRRQMTAIGSEADRVLRSHGSRRLGVEGQDGSSWLLHDYGDLVLHVFDPEARQTYDLERFWADAQRIDWREVLGSGSSRLAASESLSLGGNGSLSSDESE